VISNGELYGNTAISLIGGAIDKCTFNYGSGCTLGNGELLDGCEIGKGRVITLNQGESYSGKTWDTESNFDTSLNLSDTSIYNVATREFAIDPYYAFTGIITVTVDNYNGGATYAIDKIVKDSITGKVYKSLQNGNSGNPLVVGAWWDYADVTGGNVGRVEIETITGLPSTHLVTIYKQSILDIRFIATTAATAVADDIVLSASSLDLDGVGDYVIFSSVGGVNYKINGNTYY